MGERATLSLLGAPRLVGGPGGRVIAFPAKAFPLIAYLILSGDDNVSSREAVAQFLWEDGEQANASNNLRQLLTRMRRKQAMAGVNFIASESSHVWLERERIDVDLCRFLDLLQSEALSDVAELCRVYKGDLLADTAAHSANLDTWIRTERGRLRSLFLGAVLTRLERASLPEHAALVELAARKVLHLDPCSERAWRALMRAGAASGRPGAVKAVFDECRRRLRSEIQASPEAETIELLAALAPDVAPAPVSGTRPASSACRRSPLFPPRGAQAEPLWEARRSERPAAEPGLPRVCLLMPADPADDSQRRLANALIEDITFGLYRQRSLRVIAPHTARRLGDSGADAACARLALDYLVIPRLLASAGPPRISVKLVSARDGEILWAEQFPFGGQHAAELYRDLSVRLVSSLASSIERRELERLRTGADATAYRLYLAGQHHLRRVDLPGMRRARRSFRAALSLSAGFAPASSGVARTLFEEWLLLARGDAEMLAEAERAARRASEADPEDMRGHRELGVISLFQRRLDESRAHLDRAEQLTPTHPDLLADYADTLVHLGDAELARAKIDRAIMLNPLAPDRSLWTAGGVYFFLQLYNEAIYYLEQMQERAPAYRLLSACWAMLGEEDRSRFYRQKALETYPEFSIERWLSIIPVLAQEYKSHYADALQRAGFA